MMMSNDVQLKGENIICFKKVRQMMEENVTKGVFLLLERGGWCGERGSVYLLSF